MREVADGAIGQALTGGGQYFQIPANLYQPGQKIEEDLYLYYQGQYLLFRPKNFSWKKEDTKKLEGFGVKHLYIRCASEAVHHDFLEQSLGRIISEPRISNQEKSKIMYEAASTIMEAVYKNPESQDNVRRSIKVVESSLDYLSQKENFFVLMKLATADFAEYTHALHTATYAITLAREVGVKSYDELSAIGIGSILHDIGKIKVDKRVLAKKGSLTIEERREVERHPMYGYEIVRRQNSIPELAEKIILMHHERPNGQGYPYRLSGDFMAFAKIVAICDCFDSLTSNRHYQSACSPLEALKKMKNELADEYDQNILTTFIKMLAAP